MLSRAKNVTSLTETETETEKYFTTEITPCSGQKFTRIVYSVSGPSARGHAVCVKSLTASSY